MLDQSQSAEFVKQLTSYQRRLYVYILTFLPHPVDAEEVLQETNVVLWSKAAEFVPNTSFSAWAHKVAYFKVLEFLKSGTRDRLTFSSELMETFASEIAADKTRQDRRRVALAGCLEKLSERDRLLVAGRYTEGGSVQRVAAENKRPPSSIYRSLERIRQTLLACIQRTVTAEERGP